MQCFGSVPLPNGKDALPNGKAALPNGSVALPKHCTGRMGCWLTSGVSPTE
jgi:hypothetical protein